MQSNVVAYVLAKELRLSFSFDVWVEFVLLDVFNVLSVNLIDP